MSKYLVVLLVFCTGVAYAADDADQQKEEAGKIQMEVHKAVVEWQDDKDAQKGNEVVEGEIFSDDGENCFSESNLSEDSKKKGKVRIPSMRKLQKDGYKYFITILQNVSGSTDLTVRRSHSRGLITHDILAQGGVAHISTRVPKVPSHLTIFDNSNSEEPLWKIYQSLEGISKKKGLFVQRRGEDEICILEEALLPQIVALKISRKEIQGVFPGEIYENQKEEGILGRLSASFSLLFSGDSPSSSPSPPVKKEKKSSSKETSSYSELTYSKEND